MVASAARNRRVVSRKNSWSSLSWSSTDGERIDF
jgi:hypothetical protein